MGLILNIYACAGSVHNLSCADTKYMRPTDPGLLGSQPKAGSKSNGVRDARHHQRKDLHNAALHTLPRVTRCGPWRWINRSLHCRGRRAGQALQRTRRPPGNRSDATRLVMVFCADCGLTNHLLHHRSAEGEYSFIQGAPTGPEGGPDRGTGEGGPTRAWTCP
jgi:hypothetical protein